MRNLNWVSYRIVMRRDEPRPCRTSHLLGNWFAGNILLGGNRTDLRPVEHRSTDWELATSTLRSVIVSDVLQEFDPMFGTNNSVSRRVAA
jgi:hypothetical protein